MKVEKNTIYYKWNGEDKARFFLRTKFWPDKYLGLYPPPESKEILVKDFLGLFIKDLCRGVLYQ